MLHDSILTRMGASDLLWKAKSTFMVEVEETAEILQRATSKSLVILDELGRGTSSFDGLSIAYSVLQHLLTREQDRRPILLFITHYLSLGEVAAGSNGRFRNMHMGYIEEGEGDETEKDLTFLYKLTEGLASKSFGIHCAKLAGLPNELLKVAQVKADELEKISQVRERNRWVKRGKEVLGLFGKGEEIDEKDLRRMKELAGLIVDEDGDAVEDDAMELD